MYPKYLNAYIYIIMTTKYDNIVIIGQIFIDSLITELINCYRICSIYIKRYVIVTRNDIRRK